MTELGAAIADLIDRSGPIGFDEYMAHALYAPGVGFYQAGGGAGRRRDFLTSPEVGPLFGAILARALDTWWDDLGRPAAFEVVEAGSGPGTLARSVLAARPRCGEALSLTLVEVGEVQWTQHPAGVTSRTDLPDPTEMAGRPVVVLANELLDNLPFALAEHTPQGWAEVRVGLDGDGALVEVLAPLAPERARWCDRQADRPPVGARIPVQHHATAWLTEALALGAQGRVVVFDYADRTASMARRDWTEWLRTYAAHGRAGHPLEQPGRADITVEVATDQLEAVVRPPDHITSQARFLVSHGLEKLVDEGRRRWKELGVTGGVEALTARSRIAEAEALTDAAGLGAFRVMEWLPS